jgi:hypothetical protein
VGEKRMIRFPAVGELGGDTEVDGLVRGVGVEQVGYPGAGDDDAGVPVTGCQHAQAAGLQVERCRITPPGERVQDDGDLEFNSSTNTSAETR